jgi:hypothetical protein
MQILLGGWNKVSNQKLMNNGYKPRLNYEMVEKADGTKAEQLRCPICGVGMTYDFKERDKMIQEGRWNFRKDRAEHCGSSTCYDYVQECVEDTEKKADLLFNSLLARGFIS